MRSDSHRFRSGCSCAATLALLLSPVPPIWAQGVVLADTAGGIEAGSLLTLGSALEERLRMAHLRGASVEGSLFRSASSMSPALGPERAWPKVTPVVPRVRMTYNSQLPYSLNDDALWAGRGLNLDVLAGAMVQFRRLRVVLAPELTYSQNAAYDLTDPAISLPVTSARNPFSSPWHQYAQSIDLPIRFGESPIARMTAGESSITYDAGRFALGAATESEWWGPGIRAALLLSNNAGGFPHLFLRTRSPLASPLGEVEARWIAGGLTESPYFDYDPGNDLRSISVLGVSVRPRGTRGVTLGAARAVFAPTGGWIAALTSFPQVLRDVGQPNAVDPTTPIRPAPDALLSLFGRWVLPQSGVELYTEWARAETPVSFRDFLLQPTHSQGYTLGLQWLSTPLARTGGRVRVQAEGTYLEQSTSYRFRWIGSWYTSGAVQQGYTERGQPLGAGIGPGSSSQWVAIDHVAPRWEAGANLTRIRWLEDAHSQKPTVAFDIAYCGQDVSFLPGVRARTHGRYGTASVDYSSGWRLNVFFEQRGVCFEVPSRDQRNQSLTVTFSPSLQLLR